MSPATRFRSVAVVLAAALLLSACATEEAPTGPTLAETKSPVQLLRNETADRIDGDLVAELITADDRSSACRTEETDPEGLLRSWESSARVRLVAGTDASSVIEDVVAGFVDQGWERGFYGTETIIELTRPNNETEIHLSAKKADEDTGELAEIQLSVGGPCVMTDGADSDEVRRLESAG